MTQLASTFFASEDAIRTTMQALRNRALELTIGFSIAECGEHNLKAVRTSANRVLFFVDGIHMAASLVPSFVVANWQLR